MMNAKHITLALALCTMGSSGLAKNVKLKADNIDAVIAEMTIEEKAKLIIGTGMGFGSNYVPDPVVGATKSIVPGAAGTTYPIPRLGIPAIVLADGPAGLRIDPKRENSDKTYYCTHFPIGTLLACTWDVDLVKHVGEAIGNEVAEYGADVLLAPGMNIHRNPLCGRNFEYYSEDPLVTGKIAAAYVSGVQTCGVGTSIKHFAVNNQETNRMAVDALVSPRALREIYLKGFEIAVKESQPWTVMTSYNYLNGKYTSENPELIQSLLRDEWGFRGTVMTDWYGGISSPAQVVAGNDMLQPGYPKQAADIVAAVKDGSLDEALVDRNVRRILQLIVRSPKFNGYKHSDAPDLKAHAQITRQAATDGMVLLKNDGGALPLSNQCKKLALFGNTSYRFTAGGTGSGNVNRAYTVSLLDGLAGAGYTIDDELRLAYEQYLPSVTNAKKEGLDAFMPEKLPAEMPIDTMKIKALAAANDVAFITLGRTSGEFKDRPGQDFNLSDSERTLLQSVTKAFHSEGKKVIVVMNIGGVMETASWKHLPDAILCAWQAGQEGGNSVADVVCGKSNPSGKLTMTFPVKYTDHWSSLNFPVDQSVDISMMGDRSLKHNNKDIDYTDYDEGIYVGYRYFDTKHKKVSYPFGYGLSYTTFEYSKPEIKNDGQKLTLTFDITNTGNAAGKEIAQLYVAAPAGRLDKPAKELKGFAKTKELQPGEKQTLSIMVDADDLASFDQDISAWVTDGGEYRLMLGASSDDIRHQSSVTLDSKVRPTLSLFR